MASDNGARPLGQRQVGERVKRDPPRLGRIIASDRCAGPVAGCEADDGVPEGMSVVLSIHGYRLQCPQVVDRDPGLLGNLTDHCVFRQFTASTRPPGAPIGPAPVRVPASPRDPILVDDEAADRGWRLSGR